MIEIPEAVNLSRQLTERCAGKRIDSIVAGSSPHKFAWYYGDRASYTRLAAGRVFRCARAVGGMVEGAAGNVRFLFSEGASLRLLSPASPSPRKHQFLMAFADGTMLVASVQMYGGVGCFRAGGNDNPYYLLSLKKPSPLTDAFDASHFASLFEASDLEKLSAKAFLATEQRVPGLGNGVLQDILFRAGLNPRTKVSSLSARQRQKLLRAIKQTLGEMTERGGRDTELDLDGAPGGYATLMSKNSVGKPCPRCGTSIKKEAYLGGSVYFCPVCQPA
jgi:formamidopyrimidine-DNA glycosylase